MIKQTLKNYRNIILKERQDKLLATKVRLKRKLSNKTIKNTIIVKLLKSLIKNKVRVRVRMNNSKQKIKMTKFKIKSL